MDSQTRQPRLITLYAPKGGVGKTTIAAHLAVAAAQEGRRTLAVDCDEQGSLAGWAQRRIEQQAQRPELAEVTVAQASLEEWSRVVDAAARFDCTIVDLPPSFSGMDTALRGLLARSALILMPTGPSRIDRDVVIGWMASLSQRGYPARFVLNKVLDQRRRSVIAAREALARAGEMIPVDLPHREDIRQAIDDGLTVLDPPPRSGHAEFGTIWACVRRALDRCG